MRKGGYTSFIDSFVAFRVRRGDFDQIIGGASRQVTFQDFGPGEGGIFEFAQDSIILAI